jgi:hypothetical protein
MEKNKFSFKEETEKNMKDDGSLPRRDPFKQEDTTFSPSEYNALDKAWRDFVNYEVLPKEEKEGWDKKLQAVEGNEINLDKLHLFIKNNFTVEECENIYKKAKLFKKKADKERQARAIEESKEQSEAIKKVEKKFDRIEREQEIKERIENSRIRLPENDRLVSQFAEEIGNILKSKNMFFYKVDEKAIVEIRKIKYSENEEGRKEEFVGFKILEPDRFVSLIEQFITPYKTIYGKQGAFFVDSSMTKGHASLVLKSQQLEEKLPKIKRIFTVPIPILHNGKLTFPKKGYDERFESWMPFESIDLNPDMKIEDAKKIIYEIYNEFCFESKEDVINAFAALLTPFLRGLYQNFNDRTPLFFYIANRERAGKDYCAGITGIVYEGLSIEEPPISNGEDSRGSSHNDELKKKIMGVFMSGRKRMHFSNNRGFINNAILEQLITNKTFSDRVLGRNEILTFNNEIEISLSGNVGVTFTPDLANRCRFIRLKLAMEDPNKRTFKKQDLHNWVIINRTSVLSALYAFVREWFNNGMPKGTKPFTSFPEWARVCGGIMEYNQIGSPCHIEKELLVVGGDAETESMKKLYEFIFEQVKDKPIKKTKIIELIQEHGLQGEGVFHYLDFAKNGDKTRFGMLIEKYVDRILSGIILKCNDKNKSSRHREYLFCQFFDTIETSTLDNPVDLFTTTQYDSGSIFSSTVKVDKVDKVDKHKMLYKGIELPQDVVVLEYKIHLPCSKCGLKSSDGWSFQGKNGRILCDLCVGVI